MSTTLLFVHSPVVGPSTWTYTAEVLQENVFHCLVPDLTPVATMDQPYCPKYAMAAAAAADDTSPPGLAVQLRGLADHGLLPPWHEWFPAGSLEALVPDPARRLRLIAEIPRLPLAYFDEPAPPARFAESVACAFLRLGAPFDPAADKAERLGWWVARRDWDHVRMITAPGEVANLIAQAISAIRFR